MKLSILTLLCCLLAAFPTKGQVSNRKVALLVSECEAADGVCSTQNIIRYRFIDGVQVSKDLILRTATDRVRFDLGQNHIFRNRYVLTEWGDVIDIRTKKILHEGMGEYVATEGSRVIQHVNRTNVEGFFYYDLESRRYARLRSPNKWALPGLLSPDQTKSVSVGKFGQHDVWLHTLKGEKKLIASGFRISVSDSCCSLPRISVLWLDNDRLLSQRSNGEIVILKVTGEIEPLLKIRVGEPPNTPPEFYRNPDGQIIYDHGEDAYILEVENKNFRPYTWTSLGNGFERESAGQPSGNMIRFQGQEIGRWWACCAKTTNGFVAMEYGDAGSNLGYPKGVKVWNSINRKWITIDAKWLNTIIGWVVE